MDYLNKPSFKSWPDDWGYFLIFTGNQPNYGTVGSKLSGKIIRANFTRFNGQ